MVVAGKLHTPVQGILIGQIRTAHRAMALKSSAAVYLPLFRMMPPTRPVPNNIPFAPEALPRPLVFGLTMLAAHPTHPPPTMTTFISLTPKGFFFNLFFITTASTLQPLMFKTALIEKTFTLEVR